MDLFLCADVSELEFYGTFTDDLHDYFTFELLECTEEMLHQIPGYEEAECAGPQEKTMFFMTHLIVGLTTNSFFDSDDFEAPIKTLDDYLFLEQLDPTTQTRREVTLNYNRAYFNDDWFQFAEALEQEEKSFISIESVSAMNIMSLNPGTIFNA